MPGQEKEAEIVDNKKEKIKKLNEKVKDLKEKISSLTEEVRVLKDDNKNLHSKNISLRNDVNVAQNESNRYRTSLSLITNESAQAMEKIKQLEKQIEKTKILEDKCKFQNFLIDNMMDLYVIYKKSKEAN